MKCIFLMLVLIVNALTGNAQNRTYEAGLKEAMQLYSDKNYLGAALAYSAAFRSNYNKATVEDRFQSAAAWAYAGQVDSAFFLFVPGGRKK